MWFEGKLRSDVSGALIGIRLMFSWQWSDWLPGWTVSNPRYVMPRARGMATPPPTLLLLPLLPPLIWQFLSTGVSCGVVSVFLTVVSKPSFGAPYWLAPRWAWVISAGFVLCFFLGNGPILLTNLSLSLSLSLGKWTDIAKFISLSPPYC